MKTLILGGYGNFGARIARALAGDAAIELVIGGRDAAGAQSFAQLLGSGAIGQCIDSQSGVLSETLRHHGIELVIHTAGPFQEQGYGVALACAQAGAHYIDLADGRRFVCDFARATDAAFQAAGRSAITGASTVPALSSAVVDALCQGWQRIDTVDMCIAPAQSAPRGKATMAAVLGYCGAPIAVWSEGAWQTQLGWAAPERVEFARLKPRKAALCDIPDLELFPSRYQVGQRVMFRAAVKVPIAQTAFACLAWMRARGILRRPERLAGFLNATAPALDFLGSALGGMVVRVAGMNAQNQAAQRAWHIAADTDHGPEIPTMAAILLARRLASSLTLLSGAQICMGLLSLADFAPEFAKWGMVTDVIDEAVQPSASPAS